MQEGLLGLHGHRIFIERNVYDAAERHFLLARNDLPRNAAWHIVSDGD